MREIDLESLRITIEIKRKLRRQMEIAAAQRGRSLSDVVRDALQAEYGGIELSKADKEKIAADIAGAHRRRQAAREERRRLGLKPGRPRKAAK